MDTHIEKIGMGWLPDYPDFRDYTPERDEVSDELKALGQTDSVKQMLDKVFEEAAPRKGTVKATKSGAATAAKLAPTYTADLRAYCSPIENQLYIGSCTAHAGVGLLEYFEKRAFGRHIDASRLFLYKATRNMLHWTGDTGAFLRTTMGAMALFGVPPEEYMPYVPADFDKEPSAFCYAFGQSYQALTYYRLDPPGITRDALLKRVKKYLDYRLPSMFGFTVYSSINQARTNGGKIPFPTRVDRRLGGHAVDAVGYDDKMEIKNANGKTKGAFLIRNSWGPGWGDNGYGWLPYEYVLRGLAIDWWSLLKSEWIDTKRFGRIP